MSPTPDPGVARLADVLQAKVPMWALALLLLAGGGTAGASLLGSASGASNADQAVLTQRVSNCEQVIARLEATASTTRDNVLLLCQAQSLPCQR